MTLYEKMLLEKRGHLYPLDWGDGEVFGKAVNELFGKHNLKLNKENYRTHFDGNSSVKYSLIDKDGKIIWEKIISSYNNEKFIEAFKQLEKILGPD